MPDNYTHLIGLHIKDNHYNMNITYQPLQNYTTGTHEVR